MKIIWSEGAADDLREIVDYIAADSPEAARRLAEHIFKGIESLTSFPLRGRPRKEDNGREIIFVPWPYICVYEVAGEAIHIKAVRHASREEHG